MDRKTRTFMTMNKELHPKNDVAQLHVFRKKGRRGLIACENCVKSEKKWSRMVHQKQYRTITSCSQNM